MWKNRAITFQNAIIKIKVSILGSDMLYMMSSDKFHMKSFFLFSFLALCNISISSLWLFLLFLHVHSFFSLYSFTYFVSVRVLPFILLNSSIQTHGLHWSVIKSFPQNFRPLSTCGWDIITIKVQTQNVYRLTCHLLNVCIH